MDGWVIVGTKLDSKQLEKDLKQAERRLQQYEKEAEKLTKAKAKAEIDLQPYEEQKRLIQQTTDEALQYAQTEQEVTRQLEIEKTQLEELNTKYSKQLNNLDDINKKIQENAKNQGLVKSEIDETNAKLMQARGFKNINDIMENISKKTSDTIKKVGRWTLAIFGVRAVYGFIRNSVSTLSQYNEQMASDIEYIRFAIASSLQPLIEDMIQLVYKLLTYINYISQAWFGIDLFANASADAMRRASQSAEKMKKSLAGFDEMNILNDNGSTGAMGGLPSYDLSAPEDVEIPRWLIWIKENGSSIASIITGIAVALTALRLGLVAGPKTLILLAVVTQIVDMIQGLVKWVENLIGWFKDPSWDNFVNVWKSAIESMGLVGDLILWIFDLFGGFEKVVEPIHEFYDWINENFINTIKKNFSILGKNIKEIFTETFEFIEEKFSPIIDFFKKIISKINGLFEKMGINVGNVISSAFKTVINTTLKRVEKILNTPINAINALLNVINAIPGIELEKLSTFSLPRLAVGGVVNMPGRGVMVGSAIAGERGPEGVIPLTNSQMMAELGEAIGKYINISATVPVYVGNRQIAREIKKINAKNDFAFNK